MSIEPVGQEPPEEPVRREEPVPDKKPEEAPEEKPEEIQDDTYRGYSVDEYA